MGDDDPCEDRDDERTVELEALAAIFPELTLTSPENGSTKSKNASIDISVELVKPVCVKAPAVADGAEKSENGDASDGGVTLSNLPPLQLDITLGPQYPSTAPPSIRICTKEPWLGCEKLQELEDHAKTLWEECGRDQVLFAYVDYLRDQAEEAFGLKDDLAASPDLKVALLDFDLKAKKAKFERETFECGVCLEPKKGAVCHRLQACSHVFCIACLQDFYNSCITEGDIGSVKCLAPKCPEELSNDPRKPDDNYPSLKLPTDNTLEPSELLQMRLSQETVQRYITLKRKKALESDRNTIYCPRSWCQGPARHKLDHSNEYLTKPDTAGEPPPLPKPAERLAICVDCTFAFCLVCKASWHGEYYTCFPRSQFQITAEEKASEDYMLLHTQGCPTCDARAQKTHGCNHMICFKCDTHFCYLCGLYLEKGNPYGHFNDQKGTCYMRLWELEGGDDGEIGQAFAGGRDGGGWMSDDDDTDDDSDAEDIPAAPPAAAVPAANRAGQARPAGGAVRRAGAEPGPGLRAFLEMARRDLEDEWDSDDMSGDEDEDFDE